MGGRHARSAADTIEDFQICMVLRTLDSYLGFDIDSDLKRQILLADSIDCAVFQKVTRQNNSGFIVFHNYFLLTRNTMIYGNNCIN